MRSITDNSLIELLSNRVRPALFAKLTFAPPSGTTVYEDNMLVNGDFADPGDAGSLGADWTRVETDSTKVAGFYEVSGSYDSSPDLLLRVQENATFTTQELARALSGAYAVTPGDVIKFGGHVSAASTAGAVVPTNSKVVARLGVLFLDATQTFISGQEVSTGDIVFTAGKQVGLGWTTSEATTTVPSGAAYVQFECSLFFIPDAGQTVTTSSAGLTADFRFDSCYIQKQYDPEVRVWSGIGDMVYGGLVWKGVGTLGAISPIVETTQTQAQGITLQLSGVDTSLLAAAQQYLNAGGQAEIHLGFIDPNGLLIDSPIMCYQGLIDQVSIDLGTKSSVITVAVENKLTQLQRARGTLFTDQDQRARHPNDGGLKYVSQLADKLVVWNG
jgi:hypothetical protein